MHSNHLWAASSQAGCQRNRAKQKIILLLVSLSLCAVFGLGGCGNPEPIRAVLIADGQEQHLEIVAEALSVRDLLTRMDIALGDRDRVEPDLYVEVTDGMRIVVVRVQDSFITEQEVIPFIHQTMRSEAVPEGERRLLQVGKNGELEITYKLTLEDSIEVSRETVRSEVLSEAVNEIILVGVKGELESVPITGTIVYLSGGNAWLMRESSDLRRNITGSGDLDSRVFALSPDGSRILFTRLMEGEGDTPLNSLWMARTSLVGEEPTYLGVTGVIWATWSPDMKHLAYSTGIRTGGIPGWKAENDLWLLTLPEEGSSDEVEIENILPASAESPYAWWGRNYEWSPGGEYLAYGQSNQVGLVALSDHRLVPLASFPSFRTQSHWAWVPFASWSPDAYLISFVRHEGDVEGLAAEDSPVFGLWAISADGKLEVRLAEEVGMWASPRWSPSGNGLLAFGQAQSPRNSQDSRYDLLVMDRDGSNRRKLFPPEGMMGLLAPDVAWSPKGDAILVEYEGNLYRLAVADGSRAQLTSDGQSSHPRWAR